MDLDAYVYSHLAEWRRLEELTRTRRLDGEEADELVERYQQVATHLSVIRTVEPDAAVVGYLSTLLARARLRAVGAHGSTWAGFRRFWTHRFPAALYRLRWWWGATLAANVVLAGIAMVWLVQNPAVEQSLLSQDQIDSLVARDFENYYSEYAAGNFATQVWVNNAWVSALCIALGILGLPVVLLLANNLANLALTGAVMHRYGAADTFWGLLLPHGILELTAVFVAGGTGLRLFWSWVEPGDLTRGRALAREGRTAATVAVGLVPVLALSGLIEGFVTPSDLSAWVRVGIGVLAEFVFLAYVFVLGGAAVRDGESGDLDTAYLEDRIAARG